MERVPVIGIDLDGVLVDFNRKILELLNEKLGTNYVMSDITDYKYYKCLPAVDEEVTHWLFDKTLNTPNFWTSLAAVDRGEGVRALHARQHKFLVYALTARRESGAVTGKSTTTAQQSIHWLTSRGLDMAGVIRCDGGYNKGTILSNFGCEYFLDDSPECYLSCVEAGVKTYLMDRPYNQCLETDDRVYSVKEYLDAIEEDMENRKTEGS